MPSAASSRSASSPRSSAPTAPTIATRAPARAAATAWLAPFPPPWRAKVPPVTVSPARGRRATETTRSALTDPTTTTDGSTWPPRVRARAAVRARAPRPRTRRRARAANARCRGSRATQAPRRRRAGRRRRRTRRGRGSPAGRRSTTNASIERSRASRVRSIHCVSGIERAGQHEHRHEQRERAIAGGTKRGGPMTGSGSPSRIARSFASQRR